MKIKTLKIKVESENQEFDFAEFFTGSNTIHDTSASLVKEKDGYYWHAFITYSPKSYDMYARLPKEDKRLPDGFENEIRQYLDNNPPQKLRVRNSVVCSIERLLTVRDMEGFSFLNNVGKTSLKDDTEFFKSLLEIIKKYQTPEIKDEN
jgi:hypothetical protein